MKICKGVSASPGLVLGQVSRLERHVETFSDGPFNPEREQRMLDEAFARAADALLKLPRPEYIDLLASLAAENGQGGEALVFSAADRDTVGQAVVDAANGKKPGAGFTLAADTRETGGGVVLQRGRMEINCGFAELLRRARQEDSSAVAAVLFD